MIEFFSKLPWYFKVAAGVILIVVVVYVSGQVMSWRYDKKRLEYEAQEIKSKAERDALIGENKALKTQIAELEPQLAIFKSAAENGKKVDEATATKIEEVTKNAAIEEANAERPSDCRTRGQRVCDGLRAVNIKHDCAVIIDESCSR